jgi:hypothetical protein
MTQLVVKVSDGVEEGLLAVGTVEFDADIANAV